VKAAGPVLLALAILVIVAASACAEDAIETTTTGPEDKITAAPETTATVMPDTTMATTAEGTTTSMTNVTYYTKVNPAEAKELIDTTPDLVIIDFGATYDQGHLPGALDYSDVLVFGEGVPDSVQDALDKNVPILVYEGPGEGVLLASQLGSEGFTVYGLVGGLTAWIDAGYPVEK